METRREVTKACARRYAQAKTKKAKGVIIDEVVALMGWHRKHAIRVLGGARSPKAPPGRRGPKPRYGMEHKEPLKLVWPSWTSPAQSASRRGCATSRTPSSGRPGSGSPRSSSEMLAMSASTMDRMLASDRKPMQLKGRSTTKPGSLLKSQVPVRRGIEWDDASLGLVEVDTVVHYGPSGKGEFCCTLDATDVLSGWTELRCVRSKAEARMLQAMKQIRSRMPFALRGVDSDNGGEFINRHFMRYCEEEDLVFTRSRPYAKNDGCFVEEKNWLVARRVVGYGRYEGQAACDLVNEIYDRQRILANNFMPSAKFVDRMWDGSRVVRFHDESLTPYRRITAMKGVGKDARDRMRAEFKEADPLELRMEIRDFTQRLMKMAVAL